MQTPVGEDRRMGALIEAVERATNTLSLGSHLDSFNLPIICSDM